MVNLDFERPIIELEAKINELRSFATAKGLDLDREIARLEKRLRELTEKIYKNLTPWQKVLVARHPGRPNTLAYIKYLFTDFLELRGDRLYGDDPALIGGIARFNGRPVTILGNLKGKDTRENIERNFGMAHPEGYRKAVRLMLQAEKFKRPVLAFIDTPGAYCGMGAEERGQAVAIAQNIRTMLGLRTPVISVIVGEGGSGGALALGAGDRLLIQEHAIFAVISPEAYATILWNDPARCPEAAQRMKITAGELLALGVVEEVIPEPPGGAHRNPALAAAYLKEALTRHLSELSGVAEEELLRRRFAKFRNIDHAYLRELHAN
ncbi:MAG: acetyl-CoA carboxylase carboxyltransferase subunit alpha [Bacillota bacterium]